MSSSSGRRTASICMRFPPTSTMGMAMTVTPHGLNDTNGLNDKSAGSVRLACETSVSVASTGAIFSATPAGYGQLVVKVHGDIDTRSAPILSDYVCARVGSDVRLVLDLSVVGFFGIAGLNVRGCPGGRVELVPRGGASGLPATRGGVCCADRSAVQVGRRGSRRPLIQPCASITRSPGDQLQ